MLKAKCNLSDEEIKNFSVFTGSVWITRIEDEEIQRRLDLFDSVGVDLRDYKVSGSLFYHGWADKNVRRGDGMPFITITPEEMQKKKKIYTTEISRVLGRRQVKELKDGR
jgi:hypothetical protein